MRLLLSALALFGAAVASTATSPVSVTEVAIGGTTNPPLLSAFGFFDGSPDKPSAKLIAYTLNVPLFSDYAEKHRYIYLPPGREITSGEDGRFVFPVGTALIKSFGYEQDGKFRTVETRLLLHRADGWVALPYIWRADGKDADLRVGGARIPIAFTALNGTKMSINYAVPNKNQCKECHGKAGQVVPIGPRIGNLLPLKIANFALFEKAAAGRRDVWPPFNDPSLGTTEERVRAYLDVNCSHCHNPKGAASNSGLFLGREVTDPVALGIGKRPVAAGRGSGENDFVIDPGHPERSIMIYRLKSTDPGIAMPELGRNTVHAEGVALLEKWISSLPAK